MEHVKDRDPHPANGAATPGNKGIGRRAALVRLGLVAGAAYAAPTLALLQSAKASGTQPDGPGWVKPTKPATGPSKPGPSK